jgi:hypothetical protein
MSDDSEKRLDTEGVGAFNDSSFRLSNRKRLLKGLFYEMTGADKTGVKYTLKDEDHLGYPSLSRLYLNTSDPTEYQFALSYLESWDHWTQLCACNWFKPFISRWRQELEVKLKSEAIAAIIKDSRDSQSKTKFTANKFIVERGWEPKEGQGRTRGRPTKEQISQAANQLATESLQVQEDLERISAGRAN